MKSSSRSHTTRWSVILFAAASVRFCSLRCSTSESAHAKGTARKRGGEVELVSWDEWMAEAPSRLTVPARSLESCSPERIFDVQWAATVAERSLRSLQEECASLGRQRVFGALQGALIASREEVCYEALSRELGVGVPELRNALHRFAPALSTIIAQ